MTFTTSNTLLPAASLPFITNPNFIFSQTYFSKTHQEIFFISKIDPCNACEGTLAS